MTKCFAPSDYISSPEILVTLGEIVGLLIRPDYCAEVRGGACTPFDPRQGGPQEDYFDQLRGPHRCNDLGEYLAKHNSWIDAVTISGRCTASKVDGAKFPVPDIITHRGAPETGEYYEIKPNSASGRAAGRQKIVWFDKVIADHHLPYRAGTRYRPDRTILLWTDAWFGTNARLSLHWWLEDSGLLLYEFCVDSGHAKQVSEEFVAMLVAGFVAAVIAFLRWRFKGFPWRQFVEGVPSPLMAAMGPPDGIPAIDDVRGFAYMYLLAAARAFRRGQVAHPLFLAVVPDTDPPEDWKRGDPRPWHWNAETMAVIGDIAPDGRFEPRSGAVRTLEADHLTAVSDAVQIGEGLQAVAEAVAAGLLMDEDGDGAPIDLDALAVTATAAALAAVADEAVHYLLEDPGNW